METNGERRHSKRSPSYPLALALGFLEKVYKAVGSGPFERETFAHALGHETLSGPSSTKIAALVHFGLLKRSKAGYELSGLAEKLLSPTHEDERKRAIVEAARNPRLYAQVFERYKDQPLPTLLSNILVREYGVDKKQAARAAENFRQTAEFAGLLRAGTLYADPTDGRVGMLPLATGQAAEEAALPASFSLERPPAIEPRLALPAPLGMRSFDIPLNAVATRVAILQIPVPIHQSDLERIKKWIRFLEDDLEAGRDKAQ